MSISVNALLGTIPYNIMPGRTDEKLAPLPFIKPADAEIEVLLISIPFSFNLLTNNNSFFSCSLV